MIYIKLDRNTWGIELLMLNSNAWNYLCADRTISVRLQYLKSFNRVQTNILQMKYFKCNKYIYHP